MFEAEEEVKNYFKSLQDGLQEALNLAGSARAQNFDPEPFVEITPATDVAGRVEGIVGPKGIAEVIRAAEKGGRSRELVAYEVLKKIVNGELMSGTPEQLIEQGVRTGVGILTEGVLVAPTEGIAKFKIKQNQDGSSYLAVYYAGPIRSAGGSVCAQSVVLADAARQHFGIGEFRPTETVLERYVEEINTYDARVARVQYKPTDEEIKHIVRSCPVCIDGDPTEKLEVSVRRDVPGIETNRIRSGIALVICEGIAQKAAKVMKYSKKVGVSWPWIEKLVKVARKEGAVELKPNGSYLEDVAAGRPIFAYPLAPGGFRLRYGRTRVSGLMGKAIHPATMVLLDKFPVIGTHMKIERPGKGTVVAPCDTIEGPVVLLNDGSVVRVASLEQAMQIAHKVKEVLFLGDMLVPVGDFIKSGHFLVPGAWCDEWWGALAKEKGIGQKAELKAGEAFALSRKHNIPLHPKYTYHWHDISSAQLDSLAKWLMGGKLNFELLWLKSFEAQAAQEKRTLELLCIEHSVVDGKVVIDSENAFALLKTLGILVDGKLNAEKYASVFKPEADAMENVNALAGVVVKKKAPVYIGARMGRPEKAREREMKPAVHGLFPLGTEKNRNILKQYKDVKAEAKRQIFVEIARMRCAQCGKITPAVKCTCGGRGEIEKVCTKCSRVCKGKECPCGGKAEGFEKRNVDLVEMFDSARKHCGEGAPFELRGVKGLVSENKIPEPLEKAMLRAKHNVSVFRDGTCRFDATNVPITYFTPAEIQTSVQKLRKLGYSKDIEGAELKSEGQVCRLLPQDVLLSENGIEYMKNISKFVDDLLVCLYGMRPYYNMESKEDLVGALVVGISPHTSAGMLERIIGFTKAHVGYAHPYLIAARRRNCDGDEDCMLLLMDALLNFSRAYLPTSRGGTMDAPLVLTINVEPAEVDDEVHAMEICWEYPLSFYEAAEKFASASDAGLKLVKDVLGTPAQYGDFGYTHATSSINAGPLSSTYVTLETMEEKVNAQFALQKKLRCVDLQDAASRVILNHFLPDMYGNLRSFSRQTFRCVECNSIYRRPPLIGKCSACGGKLLLTINKGNIEKYLDLASRMAREYGLPDYMKQRFELIRQDIRSIFVDEKSKQVGLSDFI
jgi:DNA polymerase II large subunit